MVGQTTSDSWIDFFYDADNRQTASIEHYNPGHSPGSLDAAPEVVGIIINGSLQDLAGEQRSMVDSIVVVFNTPVSLDSGAFTMAADAGVTTNSGTAPDTTPPQTLTVVANETGGTSGAHAEWTITFSGTGTSHGSILSGVFDLTTDHTKVHGPSSTMASDRVDIVYRLFGDIDGDRDVDSSGGDQAAFTASFGASTGQANYVRGFDVNDDGIINTTDNFAFLTIKGTSWSWTSGASDIVAFTATRYDALGNILDAITGDAYQNELTDFAYTYDNGDRVTSETRNGVLVTYTYDDTDQIHTEQTPTATATYTYDANGNRTMAGYQTGDGVSGHQNDNRLTTDGTWNYTYDTEGNLTKKVLLVTGVYGTIGLTWNYSYDERNQLLRAERHTTDGGTLEWAVDYKYDAWGNRVKESIDSNGDLTPDAITKFALDGWNPDKGPAIGLENFDVWADLADNGSLITRYVHGDGVDDLLGRDVVAGSNQGQYWFLTDRLGSVRAVVDDTGAVVDAITYDVYGTITAETAPSYRGRYGFTGREFDDVTRLQDSRERNYDPSTGRFINQDPIGFWGGDANLYRYVDDSPTNGTDPSGLERGENGWLYDLLMYGPPRPGYAPVVRVQLHGTARGMSPSETGQMPIQPDMDSLSGPADTSAVFGGGPSPFLSMQGTTPNTSEGLGLPDWQANVRADNAGIARPPTMAGSVKMYGLDGNQNAGGAMVQGGWLTVGMTAYTLVGLGATSLSPLVGCGGVANFVFGFGAGSLADAAIQVTSINVGLQTGFDLGQSLLGGLLGGVAQWLGSACFSGDTKLLARGPWGEGLRRIDAITTADEVLSRPEGDPSAAPQWQRVEELFKRSGFLLHLRIGGQVIRTTSAHPFYVQAKGWLPAAELQRGDLLSSHDGRWIAVEEVLEDGSYEVVYNLRVAEFHTYFVGGGEWGFSVWAHNTCHGNSYSSTKQSTLYALFDNAGNFLKFGITSMADITKRYTKAFLADKNMVELLKGTRRQVAGVERSSVMQMPGPLNHEPWAGTTPRP